MAIQLRMLDELKEMRDTIQNLNLNAAFQTEGKAVSKVNEILSSMPTQTEEQLNDLGQIINKDEQKRQALVSHHQIYFTVNVTKLSLLECH